MPASAPSGRAFAATAYDAARKQVVMFGGADSSGVVGGTFVWDGKNWTQLNPAHSPSPRDQAYIAYDAATSTTVLYGGWNGSKDLSDTWTWNGTDWTQQNPTASPGARSAGAAAYLPSSSKVVLYGSDNNASDTWAWDGTTWTSLTTTGTPGGRNAESLVADAASGKLLLFGGRTASKYLQDTWTFDGTTWTKLSPTDAPPAMAGGQLAFDTTLNRPVLVAGVNSAGKAIAGVYAWDESDWRTAQMPTALTPRAFSSVQQTPSNGQLMIFGGQAADSSLAGDTQTYDWAATGSGSQYTQIPFKVDDREQLAINPATGNAFISDNDYKEHSVGFDYQIGRSYNSRWNLSTDLGPNWGINGFDDESMTSNLGGMDFYAYGISGAGTEQFFTGYTANSTGGTYATVPPGVNADLKYTTATHQYLLTRHGSNQTSSFGVYGPFDDSDKDKNGQSADYQVNIGGTAVNKGYDPRGQSYLYTYDPSYTHVVSAGPDKTENEGYGYTSGALTAATDATNAVTTYGYNGAGQLTSITSPRGNITTLAYDAFDRVTSVTQVTNKSKGTGYTTSFSYSPATAADLGNGKGGVLRTLEVQPDQQGTSTGTTYVSNHAGEVVTTIDPLGHSRDKTYNANADTITTTDASATENITKLNYDTTNQLMQVTEPSNTGSTAASTYINYSSPTSYMPSSATDPSGDCDAVTYDGNGNPTDVNSGLSGGSSHSCSGTTGGSDVHTDYNTTGMPNGTIKDTKSPAGNVTNYSYDTTTGNLTQIAYPGANCGDGAVRTLCVALTYDYYNRLASVRDGVGTIAFYTYDGDGRTTQILYGFSASDTCTPSSGNCITYAYAGDGNLTKRVDATGTSTFTFKPMLNELDTQTDGPGNKITEAFDATGLLTGYSQTPTGGATDNVTYAYNAANQLQQIVDATGTITITPDNNGNRTKIAWPGGTSLSSTYTSSGAVKTITPSTPNLSTVTNSYVKAGADTDQLQTSTVTRGGSTVSNASYVYNLLGQLTAANSLNGSSFSYGYDKDGNLTASGITGANAAQNCDTFNAADQLASSYASFDATTRACTGTATGSYQYDSNGNQTGTTAANGTVGFVEKYEAGENVATQLQHPGANTVNYSYEDAGNSLRTSATIANTSTTYGYLNGPLGVTSRTVANYTNESGTTSYTRDPQGGLIDEHGGPSGTNFYELDQQGSVIALSSTSGAANAIYTYDPYGSTHATTNISGTASENPFAYTGAYYDQLEGDAFYHLGTRYYERNGNFTQEDGQPGQVTSPQLGDLYAYTNGDPVDGVDPTGQCTIYTCPAIEVASIDTGIAGEATYGCLSGELLSDDPVGCLVGVPAGAAVGGAVGVVTGIGGIITSFF